jgi:hypothetical protein
MQDGKVTITDKQIVFDCFAELVEAMLLSYAAVEALVNDRIESLDGSVRVKRPMRVASRPNWARLRWYAA